MWKLLNNHSRIQTVFFFICKLTKWPLTYDVGNRARDSQTTPLHSSILILLTLSEFVLFAPFSLIFCRFEDVLNGIKVDSKCEGVL